NEYDSWKMSSYWVSSRNGYDLKTYYLPAKSEFGENNRNFVVISHGYTYTHHGSIKYAFMMRNLGFNVVMYDERYHGESGGENCTLGYYEKYDLEDIITDTYHRFGSDLFLGTYGESMGAATVILEQAFDQRVQFVIADCPFANLPLLVQFIIKKRFHLPKYPFLPLASLFFYLATKAKMNQIMPIDAIQKITKPILLIHGLDDGFIPYYHSQMLYDQCPSPKRLFLAPNNSRHAESYRKNRDEYTKILTNFINDLVLINQKRS
ncbi:MAG: alpha/beta hydrolase, partial [Candidatus Izemoplasmatales bacterium]|nr:alpha/beta hydrolase [Candidatus Izemoplasmatales bacterium]